VLFVLILLLGQWRFWPLLQTLEKAMAWYILSVSLRMPRPSFCKLKIDDAQMVTLMVAE
jgi:hypothetical protein